MFNKCVTVIVGTKWGDEGKGKIAAREAKDADIVMRGTGGNNAGHTVIYNGKKLALHLVPSGIIYPRPTCIIGPGVVVSPEVLLSEIKMLKENGVPNVDSRLKISGRAHVILPYHKDLDELHERLKEHPVGTTRRGIGPCYSDKCNRVGVRIYDLIKPLNTLKSKITEATNLHNQNFENNGMKNCVIDAQVLSESNSALGEILHPYIVDIGPIIEEAINNNKKIVVEGAQAYRLDLDHGDYPMSTSSNPVTAGSLCGSALPPQALKVAIGIDKAINSRVGNGIFPTELPASIDDNGNLIEYTTPLEGDVIRELAHEYGTTTGRPRRCGWMDLPILHSAKYTCGIDVLCLNHLDTLGLVGLSLGYIRVCVAYEYQGKVISHFPDDIEVTGEIPKPIYKTLEGGWSIDSSCKSYDDLPELAKTFIRTVESISEIPVKYIGIGPADDDLIVREDI